MENKDFSQQSSFNNQNPNYKTIACQILQQLESISEILALILSCRLIMGMFPIGDSYLPSTLAALANIMVLIKSISSNFTINDYFESNVNVLVHCCYIMKFIPFMNFSETCFEVNNLILLLLLHFFLHPVYVPNSCLRKFSHL